MSTQLDQDTIDIINEAHTLAWDIDGFHVQSFADELAKRGLCIASTERLKAIRLYVQDCIETGHDRSMLGNLMSARDEIDAIALVPS